MVRVTNSSALHLNANSAGSVDTLRWSGGVIGVGELSNELPAADGSLSAFNRFTPHELAFMSLRGISIVDLQNGCSNQCFGCACDAHEHVPANSMSPARINDLLNAASVLKRHGFDLFPARYLEASYPVNASNFSLNLFYGSDPVSYHARDEDGREWTIYDVIDRFHGVLGPRGIMFTTAGWKPGDNFRARAMQQLMDRMQESDKFDLGNMYSMKMLGRRARKEYDRFMERLVQGEFSLTVAELLEREDGLEQYEELSRSHVDDFVSGSKHVAMMIDNIQTLARHGSLVVPVSSLSSTQNLAGDHVRYRHLFSRDMIKIVREHCERTLNVDLRKIKFVPHSFWGIAPRSYEQLGLGMYAHLATLKSLRGGLLDNTECDDSHHTSLRKIYGAEVFAGEDIRAKSKTAYRAIAMQLGWRAVGDICLDLYRFFSTVNHEGALSVWYGKVPSSYASIPVPSSYFAGRAGYHERRSNGDDDHATMARHYRMLAGLIGKNIFA